jgi:hypothetical protein
MEYFNFVIIDRRHASDLQCNLSQIEKIKPCRLLSNDRSNRNLIFFELYQTRNIFYQCDV